MKKLLKKPDGHRRNGIYKMAITGEWKRFRGSVIDAAECIYNEYTMWDYECRASESYEGHLDAVHELDKIHENIADALSELLWDTLDEDGGIDVIEYTTLGELSDMLYVVLRTAYKSPDYDTMVKHSEY